MLSEYTYFCTEELMSLKETGGKNGESIYHVPHLTRDHICKRDKNIRKHHIQENKWVGFFPNRRSQGNKKRTKPHKKTKLKHS